MLSGKSSPPLVELKDVSFRNDDNDILEEINIRIFPGEIHAIVGDRGVGKSTLGRILAFHDMPTKGLRYWKNSPTKNRFSRFSANTSAQMVYQSEGLIDYFTVAENMFIPEQVFKPFPFSSRRRMIELADSFIRKHGFSIDPTALYRSLNLSQKVVVSFLRCVFREPELIVLDESLERLNGLDLDRTLELIYSLSSAGTAIVCISHRIDDIYNLAENVSILRGGRILLQSPLSDIDRLNLIKMCYTQVSRNQETEDINKEFYQLLRFNEAILKKLPVSLLVTDEQDKIKLANDHAVEYFSLTGGKYLNQPLSSIIDDEKTVEKIMKCFNQNTESSLIHEMINNKTSNIKIYPIFDGTFPIGNITIIEDTTEIEKMRQRISLSDNLASLGLLAAGVAHEINNPLEIIYNYLSFLQRNPNKQKTIEVSKKLEEEMDGIKQIVSTLVSFSGDKQIKHEYFNVNDLVEQTVTLLKPAARKRNINCDFFAEEEDLQFYATKSEIRQVLLNLLKNSFEVLVNGGSIKIRTCRENEYIIVVISDDGPGITVEDPEQIFLPFYSTKKSDNNHNLGLGLPISYGIVSKYKGDLSFRNVEGGGCEFRMQLPVIKKQ